MLDYEPSALKSLRATFQQILNLNPTLNPNRAEYVCDDYMLDRLKDNQAIKTARCGSKGSNGAAKSLVGAFDFALLVIAMSDVEKATKRSALHLVQAQSQWIADPSVAFGSVRMTPPL